MALILREVAPAAVWKALAYLRPYVARSRADIDPVFTPQCQTAPDSGVRIGFWRESRECAVLYGFCGIGG